MKLAKEASANVVAELTIEFVHSSGSECAILERG
jgi:hypothetical protein